MLYVYSLYFYSGTRDTHIKRILCPSPLSHSGLLLQILLPKGVLTCLSSAPPATPAGAPAAPAAPAAMATTAALSFTGL